MAIKLFLIALLYGNSIFAQQKSNPLFDHLPVEQYPVEFKIITLYDSSRVTKSLYNYFGEKETTNRYRKISVHIWYPVKAHSNEAHLNYSDYCYNERLGSTNETISAEKKNEMLNNSRPNLHRFFGAVNNDE